MSFFLKIGQTLAYFRREGKVPSVRDLLTMRVIGIVKKGENSLRRLVGILFGPEDFPDPKFLMMSLTSDSRQGLNARAVVTGLVR